MENLAATTNAVRKRTGSYLLVALLGTWPATSALADEIVDGNLIVKGDACIGTDCATGTFPFDVLRIHGSDPLLSMVDQSSDGSPGADWSIGITDGGTEGPSEFFVRDDTSQVPVQVLRMTVDGAVALGAGSILVDEAISVGRMGSERQIVHVADGENDTDAVNMRQFEAFQARALESVGGDADQLDRQLQDMSDRIDDLAARIDRLAEKVQ